MNIGEIADAVGFENKRYVCSRIKNFISAFCVMCYTDSGLLLEEQNPLQEEHSDDYDLRAQGT